MQTRMESPDADAASRTTARGFFLALAVISVLATVAALRYRYGFGLTLDEPFVANTTRLPWREIWRMFGIDNVPLLYVLLKVWTGVFGESELALRSLSSVAYGGAVFLTGLSARRIAGSSAGVAAALLMAASDKVGLEYAATVRSYALLACLSALAMWQTMRLLDVSHGSRREVVALILTHALGMFAHPSYGALALAFGCAGFVATRRVTAPVCFGPVVAVLLYGILWSSMILATVHLQTTSWMWRAHGRDIQRAYLALWGIGPGFIIVGAVLAIVTARFARTADILRIAKARWIVSAAVLSWLIPIAISQLKPVFEAGRSPMLLLPVTSAAVASLFAVYGAPLTAVAVASCCLVASVHRVQTASRSDPSPSRRAFEELLAKTSCGDTIIAPGVSGQTAAYYLRRLGATDCLTLEVFPRDPYDVFANWTARYNDPTVRRRLEAEADLIAARATSVHRTVWLLGFSHWDTQEACDLMERALTRRASCEAPRPMQGAFVDRVQRCTPLAAP